ncbi:prolipoprotein diacylglyceryl transferase [Clostridia bacterium]|nr:prolipoprotein diacylglyceryl transferase [Clostridia bacterium]
MYTNFSVRFIHLGIKIQNLPRTIHFFGFPIAIYGIIIGLSMLTAILVAEWNAKRVGDAPEIYTDAAVYGLIFGVIGARLYYVIFSWDYYKQDLIQIFNLRAGGLAIYGGIIFGLLAIYVYSRVKKLSFFRMVDTVCIGIVSGQILGRWGNFFNCEAFGDYTDGLFAMQIRKDLVEPSVISTNLQNNIKLVEGIEYIQVHPTFLYESLWNIGVFCFLVWYTKRKKFDGEVLAFYFLLYGLGRFWIEGLRTDQLKFFSTGLAVSQCLSALLCILGICAILLIRKKQVNSKVAV